MIGFTTKPLRLSINKRLINKDELGDTQAKAEGFEPCQITVGELIANIKNGYAYCAELNGRRKADNFVATDILSVDVDGGMTLSEALSHPFIQEHASFIYTTCSHTSGAHRFRVIFVLDETLTNADEARAATRSLALKLNGDPKAVDPARMFYGNTDAEIIEIGRSLPSQIVDKLIEQTIATGYDRPLGAAGTGRSTIQLPPDQIVRTAKGIDILLAEASAETEVHCPVHDDKNPSAFVLENAAKSNKGVHCSACGVTYWQGRPEPYDFDDFDRAVEHALASSHGKQSDAPTCHAVEGLRDAEVSIRSEKYLDDIRIQDGTTFIKSPKGTGKTERLARIVKSTKGRVLLIGHRRALIDSMCARMGLACYLDDDRADEPLSIRQLRYGVCLDSIEKVVGEAPYDLIVMDESEQVLAHSLSQTLDGKRKRVLYALIHILGKAKRVIAADADLSWTSFNFIKKWAEGRSGAAKTQVVINKYQSPKGKVEVFASDKHLIGDFVAAVNAGKRCYFTSNSRDIVKDIAEQLKQECPVTPILVVTSEETRDSDPAAAAFIKNPTIEAKKYQVVLASPSIGSGVDITFDGNERFYDIVYGLFVPHVLTHFECDQQLGRVRHPKQVKVYVSQATAAFETDLSVVLRDTQSASILDANVEGYSDGPFVTPIYREDALSEVAAAIISSQRASKNQLWRNFLHYKVQQGWEIEHVGPHAEIAHLGLGFLTEGKERRAKFLANRLMQAESLSDSEFDRIDSRIRRYEFADDYERASYERSAIGRFYNESISEQLIALDDRGRFRACVENFEMMLDPATREWLSEGIHDSDRRNQTGMLIRHPGSRQILLMETLSTAPFYRDFVFRPDLTFSKADLLPFVEWVNGNRIAIQQQFNIAVHKGIDKNPVIQLRPFLDMVGLELTKLPKTRAGGTTVIPYQITQASFDLMMAITNQRKAKDVSGSLRIAA